MRFVIEVSSSQEERRELGGLYRVEKDARVRQRMGVVLARWSGVSVVGVAGAYHVSRRTVTEWVKRFNREGVGGLGDKPRSGRPPKAEWEEVRKVLSGDPRDYGYPVQGWNGRMLRDAVRKKLGVAYSRSDIYYVVKQLGFTLITPRSRSYKANADEQEAWKKTKE